MRNYLVRINPVRNSQIAERAPCPLQNFHRVGSNNRIVLAIMGSYGPAASLMRLKCCKHTSSAHLWSSAVRSPNQTSASSLIR